MFDVGHIFEQEINALLTVEFFKGGKSWRVFGARIVVVTET